MALNSGQWGIVRPKQTLMCGAEAHPVSALAERKLPSERVWQELACSMLVWAAVFLGLVLAMDLPSASAEAQKISQGLTVKVAAKAYRPGETIQVTLSNMGEPIALAGCASYILERFDEDRFVTVWQKRCEWEQNAVLVSQGDRSFELPAPTGKPSLLRVTFPFGAGCREGVPLSRAACKKFGAVSSPTFALLEEAP